MLYPPCDSVFYRLNSNPAQIDVKKRCQINPALTDKEITAIYNSFIFKDGNKSVLYREASGKIVKKPFSEVIFDILQLSNLLPTARLWLRQIPDNVRIDFVRELKGKESQNDGLYAVAGDNQITFSLESLLCTPQVVVDTLIHELAHIIDRTQIGGLTAFPYEPVNDGTPIRITAQNPLSAMEVMQLILIDEAEKNAISKQLQYEMQSMDNLWVQDIQPRNKILKKYVKAYQNWMPPENSGHWTEDEIITERFNRASFYASAESIGRDMRQFLKSQEDWLNLLPKPIQNCGDKTGSESLINYDVLVQMNLPADKLERIMHVVENIRINATYRSRVYIALMHYALNRYKSLTNEDLIDSEFFFDDLLINPDKQKKMGLNKPSEYFTDYIRRIEGRYMGFIRAGDLRPKNTPDNIYLCLDKTQPAKSLVDLNLSYNRAENVLQKLSLDYKEKLEPYYISQMKRYCPQKRKSNVKEKE